MPPESKQGAILSITQNKSRLMVFILLIILGLLILAASTSEIEFQPGQPIPRSETTPVVSAAIQKVDNNKAQSEIRPIVEVALIISVLVMFTMLAIGLLRKVDIKHILKLVLALIVPIIISIMLNWIPSSPQSIASGNTQPQVQQAPLFYDFSPLGNPPEYLSRVIAFGLLVIFALFIIFFLFKNQKIKSMEDPIAHEVEAALIAIENGVELQNVIINCYLNMSKVISERDGIERESYLTPREFESLLTLRGLPTSPIHSLTSLFEKIRYGCKPPDAHDEALAVDCLSEINKFFLKGS